MSGLNETIVREYFETLGFAVTQPCKYVTPGKRKKAVEELDHWIDSLVGALLWTIRHTVEQLTPGSRGQSGLFRE